MNTQTPTCVRHIRIHRTHSKTVDIHAHQIARANLSGNGYQLYDFLSYLPNNESWALYKNTILESTSLTVHTYANAFREVELQGYLIKNNTKINCWEFYESLSDSKGSKQL